MKYISVFCGFEEGALKYMDLAKRLGKSIVTHGFGLVYGGGNVGLMKIIADSVFDSGGEVIGVITPEVKNVGLVHANIKKENLFEEATYSARKAKMSALSVGFIALPGGLSTLDDLTEVVINNQFAGRTETTDKPVKPCAVLNVDGFYDGFLKQLKRSNEEKFMPNKHMDMIYFSESPEDLVKHIETFKTSKLDHSRWHEDLKQISNTEQKNAFSPIFKLLNQNKNLASGNGLFSTGLFTHRVFSNPTGALLNYGNSLKHK